MKHRIVALPALSCLLLVLGASAAAPAVAQTTQPEPATRAVARHAFGEHGPALDAEALDALRGGFSGNGLDVSFGIERSISINGVLVTTNTLNIAGQAVSSANGGAAATIQVGAGNGMAIGSLSPHATTTVIQNSLDGQKIQALTVIDATANSLGIYRHLDLGASLRGAVIDSLRR